jgi:hypothetical protein
VLNSSDLVETQLSDTNWRLQVCAIFRSKLAHIGNPHLFSVKLQVSAFIDITGGYGLIQVDSRMVSYVRIVTFY